MNEERTTQVPGIARPSRLKRVAFAVTQQLERARVHVLPAHFYSAVPDRRWLRRNQTLWRSPTPLTGIEWDLVDQLTWVQKVCSTYLTEVAGFSFLSELRRRGIGFRYGLIEAQLLHCVVRETGPRRIVEIGSGASTALMSDAVAANVADGKRASRIVAIDPYLPPRVRELPHVETVALPAQQVPTEIFDDLVAGDLLFIDSTHVVKTGSELHRIYLELLPCLPPGVIVHIHDIYLPYLYSPWVLDDFWDWQETALLTALLSGNRRFEVLGCMSALHHEMPERLREVLPDYRPRSMPGGIDDAGRDGHFPSSIWLRTGTE